MNAETRPLFLSGTPTADQGLICGFEITAGTTVDRLFVDEIDAALEKPEGVVWLHFNLSDARARRWLVEDATFVPESLREVLNEHDGHRRIESVDEGLLLVISDFTFEADSDPAEVGALWCFARSRLLITARHHPLKSVDQLREQVRGGFAVPNAFHLIVQLLELRTVELQRVATQMLEHIDELEDEILAGGITRQREQLGRMRRLCARMRRHFGPEWSALQKLLNRTSLDVLDEDSRDLLRSATEDLGFAIEEVSELYERSKLLQEELASRVAENTNRNLYVLAILTAVFLPMTLITGIFGMNVAGLPGMHDADSFWNVTLLIIAAGVITLTALMWRRS
jgi:zinc transporter